MRLLGLDEAYCIQVEADSESFDGLLRVGKRTAIERDQGPLFVAYSEMGLSATARLHSR